MKLQNITLKTMSSQRGLTLVELMVALLIGLIIMWGVAKVFVSNRQTYATQEGLARLQENGQYALNFITRHVRQAGYYPKTRFNVAESKIQQEQWAFGNTKPITGVEGGGTLSDSLTLAYYTTATDCVGNGFPLGGAVGTQGTTPAGEAAEIALNAFTIDTGAAGSPSLFCNGVEIAEGIENLQIRYGTDTNNDGIVDSYVSFSAGLDITTVLTLQVALLVETIQEISPDSDTKTYDLLGTTIGPVGDHRLRQVYGSTIKLRDRCAQIPVFPNGSAVSINSVNSPCS